MLYDAILFPQIMYLAEIGIVSGFGLSIIIMLFMYGVKKAIYLIKT